MIKGTDTHALTKRIEDLEKSLREERIDKDYVITYLGNKLKYLEKEIESHRNKEVTGVFDLKDPNVWWTLFHWSESCEFDVSEFEE
jgi:hypothetical protein